MRVDSMTAKIALARIYPIEGSTVKVATMIAMLSAKGVYSFLEYIGLRRQMSVAG